MAMRDKNGENASERIARKFLSKTLDKVDCNCISKFVDHGAGVECYQLRLYNSVICELVNDKCFILYNHQFLGSKLSNERKRAVMSMASRYGYTVIDDSKER